MNKRGQELIFEVLFWTIISGLVITTFAEAGRSYGKQEAFNKLAVAKDLALTIDLIYGLQGDIIYTYPNDVFDYYIDIKDNIILVYNNKLGKQDPTLASYRFASLGTDSINIQIKGKKYIRLEKVGNKLRISGVDI